MNDVFTLDKEFLLKSSIYEISSISIEQNSDINGTYLEGEFIVSGTYRLHEISINKEDFSFKIPFKHELRSNIDLDTINLDINDFTYDFKSPDELDIHIEYIVSAKEGIKTFDNEESLEEFLNKKDFEIIDLRDNEDNEDKEDKEENISLDNDNDIVEKEIIEEDRNLNIQPNDKEENTVNEDMIINSVNGEEEYVLYHVHTVQMNDTIESITKKYNITVAELKEYNTFDNLELNMKLIIPNEEL